MTFKFSVAKHFATPRKIRDKPPLLTVKDIMAKVIPATKLKSRRVKTLSIAPMRGIKQLPNYYVYRAITQNQENGHKYKITVFSPTKRITLATKVVIDDPCPVFVFKYEYALAKRGNAFIFRTNGEPPVITNPRLIPGLSHHSLRALIDLIAYTKKFKEER